MSQTEFVKLSSLFKGPPLGIFADFDGTLSPIVANTNAAQITLRKRRLLSELRAHVAVLAVISGRGVADLVERVGVDGLVYIGNHGLERWDGDQIQVTADARAYMERIAFAEHALTPELLPGTHIENKKLTLSVHYREADDPERALGMLLPVAEQIANANDLALFQGRRVIELRPPLLLNKGTAFQSIVEEYDLKSAVYIGDDTTDVAAFKTARALRDSGACNSYALGVVDQESPPNVANHADLTVSSVSGVESFLSWCLSKLRASST
jgi:trehalose 6-phosphate phosphatase